MGRKGSARVGGNDPRTPPGWGGEFRAGGRSWMRTWMGELGWPRVWDLGARSGHWIDGKIGPIDSGTSWTGGDRGTLGRRGRIGLRGLGPGRGALIRKRATWG
ncbi:hypothetical protein TNIN_153311 [Trichonephila inaurata madagascariensis]|uniref:Uncharacterized protein n=1 Tax=Trichonephila inaurata madagascariensis TaxID=2747483 RepID=A0A8X7C7G7_9ARAC|nr:hypothetical protein TNIN_153311 [Trichonephila inaurata madagascariensis]